MQKPSSTCTISGLSAQCHSFRLERDTQQLLGIKLEDKPTCHLHFLILIILEFEPADVLFHPSDLGMVERRRLWITCENLLSNRVFC